MAIRAVDDDRVGQDDTALRRERGNRELVVLGAIDALRANGYGNSSDRRQNDEPEPAFQNHE